MKKFILVVILLVVGTSVWGQVDFYSAFSFSWYPLSHVGSGRDYLEGNLAEYDANNYLISALLNLKFFDKYGAFLDLKIDDVTFQRAVNILAYFSIDNVFLKFDSERIAGNASWISEKPNPIPGENMDFRTKLDFFKILYNFDYLDFAFEYSITALGFFFGTFDFPVVYQVAGEYDHHGFGNRSGRVYGATAFVSVLDYDLIGYGSGFWIDGHMSIGLGKSKFDENEIKRIENANGLDLGAISRKGFDYAYLVRLIMSIGYIKSWDIGYSGKFAIYLGAEMNLTSFDMVTWGEDEKIQINSKFMTGGIGPTARISMRF